MNNLNLGQRHFLLRATQLIIAHTGKTWDEAQEVALDFFQATNWKISTAGLLMFQADLVSNSGLKNW